MKSRRGFTAVELLITISIIGILSSMAYIHYYTARADRDLDRAAWELASDIHWLQQMSFNDALPRQTTVPKYTYHLRLQGTTFDPVSGKAKNSYSIVAIGGTTTAPTETVLKNPVNFSDYSVNANISTVGSSKNPTSLDMTFYSYDVDYLVSGVLANMKYQIVLTHSRTGAARYVNVDSRVGRVWVTRTPSVPN